MRERRDWPVVAAAAAVAVVALAAAGVALAPKWQRPELAADRGFKDVPEVEPPAEPAGDGSPLRREEISVPVGGSKPSTLGGTVISPGTPGPHPAIVYVHGAGTGTRDGYVALAERMARAGFVGLVYDKRTVDYTFLHRDYGQLADDAAAMVRLLRSRSDVDPAKVGLWGISEGGWVVPLAATRAPEVAFTILVSAPTVSPGDQASWTIDDGLQRLDAPGGARRLVSRAMAVGGPDYVHHDPLPALRELRQPVLALYGTDDRAVPPAECAKILVDTLDAAGNHAHTVRFFTGADHGLTVGGAPAPGYVATMASWIAGLPATGTPPVGGLRPAKPPVQRYAAVAQPSGLPVPALTLLFGLVAAGYLAGPVAALVGRRRRRGRAPDPTWLGLRPRIRRMAGFGAGTAIGMNLAIGGLVALSFTGGPAFVAPATWAALRLAAVGAVVASASTGVAVAGAARGGWRPRGVARVALLGASGATGIVLLLAAYWGLFAPAW